MPWSALEGLIEPYAPKAGCQGGRPGKRRVLKRTRKLDRLLDKLETVKACIRAKVEHPFRAIKRQFGYTFYYIYFGVMQMFLNLIL